MCRTTGNQDLSGDLKGRSTELPDAGFGDPALQADLLLEAAGEGLYAVDLDGRLSFSNRAAERLLGYGAAELTGQKMHALIHHSHEDGSPYPLDRCPVTQALQSGATARRDDEVLWTKAGDPLPVEYAVSPIMMAGQIRGAVVTFNDIRQRRAYEEALRRSERDYRLLFLSHPEPMWLYEIETLKFIEVNDAALKQYGYSREEFGSMTIRDIRPAEDVDLLMDNLQEGQAHIERSGPWRHRRKDGTMLEVEIVSHSVNIGDRPARLVVANDVTEKNLLERQMSRAERMESIGQLAGGVAHDFNNLLSVIINYAGFVKETVADSSVQPDADRWQSVTDDVAQIERAAVRATELTQQLLAFARRETVRPETVDINGVVKEVSQFLHRTLGEEVELRAALAPSLRLVEIDPGKLEQVLVNLAVNARDAMRDGGTLTITTENIEIGAGDSSFPGVPPGPAVRLQVADTGAGMEDDVIERAFEPFFTTKPAGVGTGLGLATVYGIITSAGGALRIDSGVGAGTTFTVVLPEAPAPRVRE